MSLRAPDEPSSRNDGAPGRGSLPGSPSRGIEAYALVAGIARGENASLQLARSPVESLPPYVALKRPREGRDNTALTIEATVLAQVQSPFIVRAFELGAGPLPYLVLEYVEGLSMREIVDLEPPESRIRFVIPAMVDALRGLQTLHAHGLFHQAPCLRHIMVGVDGSARLIDFAHAAGSHLPVHASRLVPSEMAPEQVIAPENVDARCDVFIAAVSLWEALTGQRPFASGRGEQAVQELLRAPIAAPSQVAPQCPPHFDRLLERALSRAPWKRFGSAAEMADVLEETARRHGLYASREETILWLRSLIARTTDARTTQRPSVRAVANRSDISAFAAMPEPPSSLPPIVAIPPRATPQWPVDDASSEPRRAKRSVAAPAQRVASIEIAQTLAMIEAFPALPSVDDEDTFIPPTPRRSRAANVLGVLLSTAVLVAGGVALRERLTPRTPAPAPMVVESRGSRPPQMNLTPASPTPAPTSPPASAPPSSSPTAQPEKAPAPARPVAGPAAAPPAAATTKAIATKTPAPKPLVRRPVLAKPVRAAPVVPRPAPKPAAQKPAVVPTQAAPAWKGGAMPGTPLQAKPVAATPWVSGGTSAPQ